MRTAAFWKSLWSSFWFVPAVFVLTSIGLFGITHRLDVLLSADLSNVPLLFSGGPSAASDVLSAIAGSSIAVVGTAFSLTIVTFTLASGQYTPRMLKHLSADRGLRVVLGAYLATFVYALLALRTVRFSGSSGGEFVPLVSTAVAFFVALVCVALLIYFIYHVINLIQPSAIFHQIYAETMNALSRLPDSGTNGGESDSFRFDPTKNPELNLLRSEAPDILKAGQSGYIQHLEIEVILKAVCSAGRTRLVELPYVVGDFVPEGVEIVRVWPACKTGFNDGAEEKVRKGVIFGKERTIERDITFGLRQLADISLKGLSPSTNDPTTAMQALDRTEGALIKLGVKDLPGRTQIHKVNDAEITVLIDNPTFEDFTELSFDQSRRAAFSTGQVIYLKRSLEAIERAMDANHAPQRRLALWRRAFSVAYNAPSQLPDRRDALTLTLQSLRIARKFRDSDPELSRSIENDLKEILALWGNSTFEDRVREAVSGLPHPPASGLSQRAASS